MHRPHAIRLALLCCTVVAVLAACGSGSNVQENYGSLGNAVCGKLIAATTPNSSAAQRLPAIEAALSGLQALHPPSTVETIYAHLLYHFKAAVDILKTNIQTISSLAKHLQTHPNDKVASRQYARIVGRVQRHLRLAAADSLTLGMGRCNTALSS